MPRVFVVGNISLDLILGGINDFPDWGVEVLVPGYVMRPGGAGSNAALALASLGMETFIVGTIGIDEAGREIQNTFRQRGIRTDFLFKEESFQTGLSVALTHRVTRERTFFTELGAQSALSLKHLEFALKTVENDDFILICGYFLSPGIRTKEFHDFLQRLKQKKKVTLLFDTGWPPEDWTDQVREEIRSILPFFDYFLPNEKEIAGFIGSPETLFKFFSGTLVVKEGQAGCHLYTPSFSLPKATIKVEVRDTIGAGDYFNAGLIWALGEQYNLEKALWMANLVASLNIASSPKREKLVGKEEVQKYG
ncbi:MAG: carbohydrate kinase family protein [Candidatus Caldatribacteriaceae bacterium]